MLKRFLAVAALVVSSTAIVVVIAGYEPPPPAPRVVLPTPTPTPKPVKRRPPPAIKWRSSVALGSPSAGRLVRGVRLPARGRGFVTWDPVRKRMPNRWWRRNGTDGLVRVVLRVAREYAAAHPKAPPVLIGDLSRPHGGDFGRRFGPLGHLSHQNGLDADVYYPRRDRRERAPRTVAQVDRRLAQDLVDRFLRAGAQLILVGLGVNLHGPHGVVQRWPNHDNHLHVRFTKSV